MEDTKQLENYLNTISDEELAETLDFAFSQEFQEIDPDFHSYYKREIDRLRAYDALKVQLSILQKEKSKIKKYLKDEHKYQIIMNNLQKINQMYIDWKESLTPNEKEELKVVVTDWQEEFVDMCWYDLEEIFPDIKITVNLVKKILRTARSQNDSTINIKEKYKITPPVKPEKNERLKENQIDRSYSEKTDAELLQMLNRNDLEYLADMVGDAVINQKTDKLRMAIRFTFAHYCQSNTKGKEYSRTDKQTIKDASKTSGKNIVDLLKNYNSMLSE